jgi:hypothetical protein
VLYPCERTPDTHGIGGWVAPRAGLDALEREKSLVSAININSTRFVGIGEWAL